MEIAVIKLYFGTTLSYSAAKTNLYYIHVVFVSY